MMIMIMIMTRLFIVGLAASPSIFKTCYRDEPDVNDCLKDAIQMALKDLIGGYNGPGLKIPPLDPVFNKKIVLEYKHNQIYGKVILRGLRTYGLSKAKVIDVRADLLDDRLELDIDMSNQEVFIEGYVDISGQFNAIHLPGAKGYFNNTMRDLTWTWRIRGLPEVRANRTYMVISYFSMRPKVGYMRNYLPTLFPDNPELNRIALDFANAYWRQIYQELLPIVEGVWSNYGVSYVNKIFKNVPYDELFPLL